MKTIISIIAALLFSTLFYGQNIGLNLSVFSVITIGLLIFQHPKIARLKSAIVFIVVYFTTAIVVYFNHSALAIFANCVAFFTLIGTFSESRSSIYIRWLNGIYTTIAAYFQRRSDSTIDQEQQNWKKNRDYLQLAKLIGIPLMVSIVFILMYKNGNPIFNGFIEKINFEFINFQWFLFSLLGFFLFNNIINPVQIHPATTKDLQTDNQLHPTGPLLLDQLKKEQQLGILLMALLNILLIFYSITDIYYLLNNDITSASALSSQVHSGINTLIASIIVAILIILYLFRGNLNFYQDNVLLKNLSYTWIFLNIGLVVLIAIKNTEYVVVYGFTYKRIGVFTYLFLTLAGLITTFLKVRNVRNLWFLFRINTQVAFAILMVSSCIDWNHAITNYNLKHAENLDLNYLIDLTDNNAILLQDYTAEHRVSSNQQQRIHDKYIGFIDKVSERNWQEWTYDNILINKKFDR